MAEICRFENNNITITQYGGVVNNINKVFDAYSHYGYRATDFVIEEANLYALCELKCVFHAYISSLGCVTTIFETVEPVMCTDGKIRDLTLLFCHGGAGNEEGGVSSIPVVSQNNATYKKGDPIYQMGKDAAFTIPIHIHLDIMNGHMTDGNNVLTSTRVITFMESFPQSSLGFSVHGIKVNRSLNFHEVFFDYNEVTFSTVGGTDYTSAAEEWDADISFIQYTNAVPTTGWYYVNGNYNYYENGIKVTGWKDILSEKYYFDSSGAMANGWRQLVHYLRPSSPTMYWFYFNSLVTSTSNPHFYTKDDGVMMKNTWVASGLDWYYVGQHGDMLVNEWIAADSTGNVWYYVKADGKMAYNESITLEAGIYHFDTSGKCTNPFNPE